MKWQRIFLVVTVLITAFWLRWTNYDKVPFPGESQDEYSYAWMGMSLIELGVPVGHTSLPGYEETDYRYINVDMIYQRTARGLSLSINRPWMDHPPAMGLIVGGWAHLRGARVFEDAGVRLIRQPMVVLGVITVGLVMVWGGLMGGFWVGLLAGVILAVSPLATVSSRMVQAENGWVPCLLLSMILLELFLKRRNEMLLLLSAIVAGVGVWFKAPAVVITLIGFGILMSEKGKWLKKGMKLKYLIASGTVAFLVVVYGVMWGGEQFWVTQIMNAGRGYGLGFDAWYKLISGGKITIDKYLSDGMVLAGWIATMILVVDKKMRRDMRSLLWVITGSLTIYLFMGSSDYGWYRIPFYPMLALALSRLIVEGWKKIEMAVVASWLGLLIVGLNLNKWIGGVEESGWVGVWKWGVPGLILAGAGALFYGKGRKSKWLMRMIMIMVMGLAIWVSLKYNLWLSEDNWYKAN